MDVLSIIGIVIGILIAIWQNRKAAKSDKMLAKIANELPVELINNISRIINKEPENEIDILNKEHVSSDHRLNSQYADINNDGNDELIVQLPAGVHGSALQVYGWKDWEFTLLAEISTDTPVGFFLEDFDKDGIIEVGAPCTSSAADLPYVCGLRDFVWYRLQSNQFVEVKRELPTKEEIEEKLKEYKQ